MVLANPGNHITFGNIKDLLTPVVICAFISSLYFQIIEGLREGTPMQLSAQVSLSLFSVTLPRKTGRCYRLAYILLTCHHPSYKTAMRL
jgi:hypothetical protein